MTTAIKFGTSGWRAIVADEFTVANIRLAVAGIAAYVKTQPEPHRVLVGRDPRFLGESFVAEAARVLAGAGITPIVIPEAAPTPAIAYAVRTLKASGAINFTASHNPPEYNGIKFSTHDGAPAHGRQKVRRDNHAPSRTPLPRPSVGRSCIRAPRPRTDRRLS